MTSPIIGLFLLMFTGLADAAPWDFFRSRRAPEPPRREEHRDHRDHRDHRYQPRGDYRQDYRSDRRRPMSLEARVQLRLRDLGFYRGPVDGLFGRSSRAAVARFQHSRGIRPSGVLTNSTIQALRLGRSHAYR